MTSVKCIMALLEMDKEDNWASEVNTFCRRCTTSKKDIKTFCVENLSTLSRVWC